VTDPRLVAMVKQSEGCRLHAYDDATGEPVPVGGVCRGTLTIGYGHTGPGVTPGQICTQGQADAWLESDLAFAQNGINWLFGGQFADDDARLGALTDIVFNMGARNFSRFYNTVDAIRRSDWPGAHDGLLNSLWHKQVGGRAERDAAMILTNEWPQEDGDERTA
jgi:lysozyme